MRLRRPARLSVEQLEDRCTPATASLAAGVLTINYIATGTTAEAITLTNNGTNIVLTGNVTGTTTNPVGSVTGIVLTDSGGGTAQTVTFAGTAATTLGGGLTATGVDTVKVNANVTATGTAAISVTTPRSILVSSSGALMTVNGNLTLSANQQAIPTTGSFPGVYVNGGSIQALGSGVVTILGKGGTTLVLQL